MPTDTTIVDVMGLTQKMQIGAPPRYDVQQAGDGADGFKTSMAGERSNGDSLNLAALTVTQDFAAAQVTAVVSYSSRDNSVLSGTQLDGPLGSPALGGTQSSGAITTSWTGEVRATSTGDGPLQWIVGAYGFKQTRSGRMLMQLGFGAITFADQTFESVSKEYAGFGELSYAPIQALTLTAGLRYSNYENELMRVNIVVRPGSMAPLGLDPNSPFFDENNTTLKFQASYAPADGILTYIVASQGFRPGGFNPNYQPAFNNVPPTFASDSLWNYEVGVKATMNRRTRVNAALYRIDWSNMQVQGFAPAPTGPNTIVYATNASASRIVGLEIEAAAAVTDNLSLDLAFNHFFQNELTQDAPVNPNGLAPMAGDPLSFNPVTSFNAGMEYRAPVMGLQGSIRLDWSFAGHRFTGFRPTLNTGQPNAIYNRLPPYHLVNLRFSLSDGPWRASLFIDNIADARPILVQENTQMGAVGNRITSRPRTIGINLSSAF